MNDWLAMEQVVALSAASTVLREDIGNLRNPYIT